MPAVRTWFSIRSKERTTWVSVGSPSSQQLPSLFAVCSAQSKFSLQLRLCARRPRPFGVTPGGIPLSPPLLAAARSFRSMIKYRIIVLQNYILTPKNFGQTRQTPSSSTVSSPKTTRRLVRHATLCSPEQLDGAGYQARIYRWSNHKAPSKRRGSRWTNRAVRGWRLYASRACNYRRSWRAGFDFVGLWCAPVCCRLGRCMGLISNFFYCPHPPG